MEKIVYSIKNKRTEVKVLSPEEESKILSEWANNLKKNTLNEYLYLRKQNYGSIEDQLDMLYKDLKNGTSNWVDHISNIKEKYPKP